jgi:hypothetical protein
MIKQLSFLFILNAFYLLANATTTEEFNTMVPACDGVVLTPNPRTQDVTCGTSAIYLEEMPEDISYYQNIVSELGAGVALNSMDSFFVDFRNHLSNRIENNLLRMKTMKACTLYPASRRRQTMTSLGYRDEILQAGSLNQMCDNILEGLRLNIGRHWGQMRDGLEIGFGSRIQSTNRITSGNSPNSRVNLSFNGIPVDRNAESHRISGHIGRGFAGELEPLGRDDTFRINETMYNEMVHLILAERRTWYQTPRSEIQEFINSLNDEYPRRPAQRLSRLRDYITSLPQHMLTGSGHSYFASDWNTSKGDYVSVVDRYQNEYFEAMQEASPLLPYMEGSNPSNDNIGRALDEFIADTEAFYDSLQPGAENPIRLRDMASFLPSLNEFTARNPRYCGYTKMFLDESLNEQQRESMTQLVSSVGLGAACLGSFFVAPTGAPLVACGAASAYGVYEYDKDRMRARQLEGETRLSVDTLEASSFEELSAAQQQEYLSLAFVALDGAFAIGDGVSLVARTAQRLSRPTVAPRTRADATTIRQRGRNRYTDEALDSKAELLPEGGFVRAPQVSDEVVIYASPDEVAQGSDELATVINRSFDEDGFDLTRIGSNEADLPKLRNTILSQVKDPELSRGFAAAFDRMHDPAYVQDYLSQLRADVFQTMLNSGDEQIMALARRGELDTATVQSVLEARAAARGQRVAVIKDALTMPQFRQYIGRGVVIDEGFSAGSSHGVWTHIVQQDMTYDIILENSGRNIRQLEQFLQTKRGGSLWESMYDGWSSNVTNPEAFGTNFVQPLLNLSYIPARTFKSIA